MLNWFKRLLGLPIELTPMQRLCQGEAVVISLIDRHELEALTGRRVTVTLTTTQSTITGVVAGFYAPQSTALLLRSAVGDLVAFPGIYNNARYVFVGDDTTIQLVV